MSHPTPVTLTIAVICKNEEHNIGRCLASIFADIGQRIDTEVLVVDSYSTDNTIEIASRYAVKIIRLRENWPHSPAAGRHTAFRHAKGKYTMCIDADMALKEGFLERAVRFMNEHQNVAGVTGRVDHIMLVKNVRDSSNAAGGDLFPIERKQWNSRAPGLVRTIPGAGLFRTSAVLQAGNFQPFLRAEEEYELCQRLRKKGYELWYLPHRIADHYGYAGDKFHELKRRWKRGFMIGVGQMFKLSLTQGFFVENIRRYYQHLLIGGYLLLGPLFLALGLYHPGLPLLWGLGILFLLLAYWRKKQSLQEGLCSAMTKALIGVCIFRMLFSSVPESSTYPTEPIIIDPPKAPAR